MKAARLVVLGVAVVAGGIAAYLAAGGKAPPPPPPAPRAAGNRRSAGRQVRSQQGSVDRQSTISAGKLGRPRPANSSFIKKSERPNAVSDFVGAIVRVRDGGGRSVRDPYGRDGQRLRLHGCRIAARHARGGDRYFAREQRRRLHPAGRPGRRRADAPRQSGGKGCRRREIHQRHDLEKRARAGGRSGGREEKAGTRKCWARPPRSN